MAAEIEQPMDSNVPARVVVLSPAPAANAGTIPAWRRAVQSMIKARWPVLAILILAVAVFAGTFAPQIAPKDPNRQTLVKRLKAPFSVNAQGQMEFPLGSDTLGRDVLSRLI